VGGFLVFAAIPVEESPGFAFDWSRRRHGPE
jgi:hypothetical protein